MAFLTFEEFRGAFPAREDRAMPPGGAALAHNTRIENGKIKPARENALIQPYASATAPATIHRYTNDIHWMEFDTPAEVVRKPIPNDTWGRVLFTAEGLEPRYVDNATGFTGPGPYPTVSYPLGVEAPAQAPVLALAGTATNPEDLADTRYYRFTIVDKFGQEGPPGPPSDSVTWRAGQTVDVTNIPPTPAGSHQYTHLRLYRTAGTADGGYQLVLDSIPFDNAGTASVNDAVAADALLERLETAEFEPPAATMRGLMEHPAGFLAGYYDNVVAFAEPGFTYAWPPRYEYHVPANIVGMIPAGDATFVLTDGQPYAFVGQHPGSMARQELPVTYACVAPRAAAVVGGALLYPGRVGMVRVDGQGGSIATLGLFDREQWQAFDFNTMLGCRWGERYMFVATANGVRQAYVFDPASPEDGVETLDCAATAVWEDRAGGRVFIVEGTSIYEWAGASTDRTYTYRTNSGLMVTGGPNRRSVASPSAPAFVTARGPSGIDTTVYRDGAPYHTVTLFDSEPEALPGDQEAVRFALEFTGTEDVYDATLAEALWELDAP